jgi:transcriptional regulator with XRE-family HTH domain
MTTAHPAKPAARGTEPMTGRRTSAGGQWLRGQRQARGWSVPQMARKLREAGTLVGDVLPGPDCLATMIRRWERGSGISERYQLHYCRAFQIHPEQFGSTPGSSAPEHEPVEIALVIIVLPAGL